MIDSNETLMYENGRDAGYLEGYEDGLSSKIKTISPGQTEVIVLSINFDKIALGNAEEIFDIVQSKFPNNSILVAPDVVSLESWDKDYLLNYAQLVNKIIKAKEETENENL